MSNSQVVERIKQNKQLAKKIDVLLKSSKKRLDKSIQHGIIWSMINKAVNF